jgi:radical SAM family uncharacterized protein/radical SAM-linked protein
MRHVYADFIDRVAKPARYLGGEYGATVKDGPVDARVCLAFPDVYDIGMSHLGTKIIYALLNREPRIACERAFAPWLDLETELRARSLPLVSLETQRPLAEFDVLGFSLQYELTFTNVLAMLELGGLALRAADRAEDSTLVLVGGPTASHAEPLAAFYDAAFVGEAEEQLPALVLAWARLRAEIRAGARTRRDALAELAHQFALYVPALYATETDRDTGMTVVGAPLDARVPARVARAMVADLDRFPFPADTPVPYAEAVFERASVEIARGCTEGCRFCQAGMIYRPVRERSPQSIADTLIGGVERAGYDETGLTCLSTADFSSITPLVKKLAGELKQRGVAMSVASLRAYGLSEELLDELATTRINGLTFAPEAGTQRMRDVVNKNVTEAHVEESSRRVFARGWHRLKLYFMIGLPTEEDDDVRGIAETGARMLRIGRGSVGGKAEVTVSVSSHVPKPHTPFQWCAQDVLPEIERKQGLLRHTVLKHGDRNLRLKHHDSGISFVEGVLARGDRRLGDAIERAYRDGSRFDGWEEVFDLERWQRAFAACGVDTAPYLATRPITARLPWDHIDVGLEDGFLLGEYRRALKGRASPPCGKVAGMLLHHTNLAEAEPDRRKLVCYDCGVACDLVKMREDRLVALRTLGAEAPSSEVRSPKSDRETERAERVRLAGHKGAGAAYTTYRVRFAKVGRAAFLGHLDLVRLFARSLRRAKLPLAMTRGYAPKPRLVFGPALPLGVPSLGELVDVDLECALPAADVREQLAGVCAPGIELQACEVVRFAAQGGRDVGLGKLIGAVDLVVRPAPDGIAHDTARVQRIAAAFLARGTAPVERARVTDRRGPDGSPVHDAKTIDVRALVLEVEVLDGDAAARLCAALEWPDSPALVRVRVRATAEGSAKPTEVVRALGVEGAGALVARLGVVAEAPPVAEREARA